MLIGDTNHSVENEQSHSQFEKNRSPCAAEVGETVSQASENDVPMKESSSGNVGSNAAGIDERRKPRKTHWVREESMFDLG